MSAGSATPTQNNGFSVFFINGNTTTLIGGGSGQGLGIISNTDVTTTSAVSGLFAAIGFDVQGTFSKNSYPFNSGNASSIPNSICLRVTPDFKFIGSTTLPLSVTYPYNNINTIRIDVRNKFRTITISTLNNTLYTPLTTFDSSYLINSGTLPSTGKFGIGFSGDTVFYVQDINVNYS